MLGGHLSFCLGQLGAKFTTDGRSDNYEQNLLFTDIDFIWIKGFRKNLYKVLAVFATSRSFELADTGQRQYP